jgi:hypothetical protein
MGNQSGNCYSNAHETKLGEIKSKNPQELNLGESQPQQLYETLEAKQPVNRRETKTLYNGKVIRGMSEGGIIKKGTIDYPNGDKYEGEIMGDMAFGEGDMNYANGDWYTGQFEQDKRNGWGKLVMKKGNIYKGNFLNNKYEGEGEFQFRNGNSYIGK